MNAHNAGGALHSSKIAPKQQYTLCRPPHLLGVEAELSLDSLEIGTAQGCAVDSVAAGLAAAVPDHRADLKLYK